MYPFNGNLNQKIRTSVSGVSADMAFLAHLIIDGDNAAASDTDGVLAAVTDTGIQQVITENIINPLYPRNITATAGGTATNIKAIQVIIEGTNFKDEIITETLPVFTVDTAGTVQGSKAFKTVTKITIPAHDGTGATTSIGFGEKLGLPYLLPVNTVLKTYLNGTIESTAPTVTVSAADIENNTIDLNSSLNGTDIDVYLMV
jgi:hypothetical protein